jgi:hypothetical protein
MTQTGFSIAIAAIGLAAIFVVLGLFGIGPLKQLFRTRRADDEAPIIVKNGSMYLWAGFDPPNNGRWFWRKRPINDHHPKDGFYHEIAAGQPPDSTKLFVQVHRPDKDPLDLSGDRVTVTYSDGFSVDFGRDFDHNNRRHTRVEASASRVLVDATDPPSSTNRHPRPKLRYAGPTGGFIKSVTVDGKSAVVFDKDGLKRICISRDFPIENCDDPE